MQWNICVVLNVDNMLRVKYMAPIYLFDFIKVNLPNLIRKSKTLSGACFDFPHVFFFFILVSGYLVSTGVTVKAGFV